MILELLEKIEICFPVGTHYNIIFQLLEHNTGAGGENGDLFASRNPLT
jgi:hypothetical protein